MPTDRECCSCLMGKFKQIPQKYEIDSGMKCDKVEPDCNQQPPYYKLGPHIHIENKARYVYTMPNQKDIGGIKVCKINKRLYPWYGLP